MKIIKVDAHVYITSHQGILPFNVATTYITTPKPNNNVLKQIKMQIGFLTYSKCNYLFPLSTNFIPPLAPTATTHKKKKKKRKTNK
jgi:hypothetical protein